MNAPDIDWPAILGPILSCPALSSQTAIEQLNQAVFRNPPRAIRLASHVQPEQLPFATQPVAWFERGRIISSAEVRPGGFLHYAAGCYYIQDAGSLLAAAVCDIQPGQLVCDLCAAPGGKSTALLEKLDGTGLLVSNEVIGSRLPPLTAALWRTGYHNHLTTSRDAESLAKALPGTFDCVLVDAPCSGQSMLSRGKQSLASFSEHQIAHSAARQARIIRAAAELVKPGGRLVYSTCTFAHAENEQIIEQFLAAASHWSAAPSDPRLAEFRSPTSAACYRLWPHRDSCAGGFTAALVRSQDAPPTEQVTRRGKQSLWQPLKKIPAEVASWFASPPQLEQPDVAWFQYGDRLQITSPLASEALIRIAYAATPVATEKTRRWDPQYAAALLRSPAFRPAEVIELSDQQASEFMGGQPLRTPATQAAGKSRWCQVAWQGHALSWGKLAGGMLKNHLPKSTRQNVPLSAK